MPQMHPMNWIITSLTMFLIIIILTTHIYFNYNMIKPNKNINMTKKNTFYIKW